jgi:CBS domain-containing protein
VRSQTAIFSKLVRDFMRPLPLTVSGEMPLVEVAGKMASTDVSSALIVDAKDRLQGIITDQDMTRRVAFQVDAETPVSELMTSPVMSIDGDDYLYHAIARMRRHELKHMPVVDGTGKVAGMLDLIDTMAVASNAMMAQIDRLTHEGSIEGLKGVKDAQVQLARELLDDTLPAPDVQALLTDINKDIYRRVISSALTDMKADGLGSPPVPFAAIVFGSGGRGENYLFPDQDNGFIIADYPDEDHNRIDGFFRELAERMTLDLDAVGLPLCKGYCMATNPLWRKTLSQWIDQIGLWSRKHNFVAIRLSDIFFDFMPVYGDIALATDLRKRVATMIAGNHFYLSAMFHEIADHNVALGAFGGFFGGFVTETEDPDYKGFVNLKHTGTLPMVEAIRLLSLREGIIEAATLARIQALHRKGILSDDEVEELTVAFELLTDILLNGQVTAFEHGKPINYYVDPERLSKHRQKQLTRSLQAVDSLRKRVNMEFTADIF